MLGSRAQFLTGDNSIEPCLGSWNRTDGVLQALLAPAVPRDAAIQLSASEEGMEPKRFMANGPAC